MGNGKKYEELLSICAGKLPDSVARVIALPIMENIASRVPEIDIRAKKGLDGGILVSVQTTPSKVTKGYEKGTLAREIARFSLAQLPGCCGYAVSYHSWIDPTIRGLGLATKMQEVKNYYHNCYK